MKPEEVMVAGKDYFAWPYEEQTKVKHNVLSTYFKIWVSKLGKYNDTLFMDCHGGCGAYIDKNTNEIHFGSSVLVDKIATEVNKNRSRKNYICVCEKEEKNINNLQKVWKDQNCSRLCRFKNEDFNVVLNEKKLKEFYQSNPSLFFMDPFGYDLKMQNLKSLMNHKGNEIIINFMFDCINRFLCRENLYGQVNEYFGSDDWQKALKLKGSEREIFLVDLYKKNLKKITGAKFVFPYRLSYPEKNQTYYYLIHATNDIQGITHMKNAFACSNYGRVEYIGKRQDNISLFDLGDFKNHDLENNLCERFSGRRITFENVWAEIVEDIPYLEKDLSDAINYLSNCGRLVVTRKTSKRGSYRGEDVIYFGEKQ